GAKVSVYADSSGSNLLASTTTDGNGSYTVSRVVWSTSSPAFGKTADYTTIYIQVTHDDYATSDLTAVKIVSDSTNGSQGDVQLTRTRFTMPTFSGRVTSYNSEKYKESGDDDYDDYPVWLCYKDDDGNFVRYSASSAETYTTSSALATYDTTTTYTHGNFAGLGGSTIKWEGTQGDNGYAESTVYIVFDYNKDLSISTGDTYATVTIQSGTDTYTVSYNNFTGEISD
ncbi:MAG: hypothetical protein K5634_04415, partial [Sphaerochaetaceae bacterium]|nr:hypothetical protein [Sphaerochaetaceae bacterium]